MGLSGTGLGRRRWWIVPAVVGIVLLLGVPPLLAGPLTSAALPQPVRPLTPYQRFPGLGIEAPYAMASTVLQNLKEPVQEWRLPGYNIGPQMTPPWIGPGSAGRDDGASNGQVAPPSGEGPAQPNNGIAYLSAQWKMQNPSVYPSPRTGAAMAFDNALGKIVLFGGHSSTGPLNDTWTYQGGVWTNISAQVTGAPAPRYDALMTYDASDGALLMVGGYATSMYENQSYLFNGTVWTATASIPVRTASDVSGPTLTYDALDGFVIFDGGGYGSNGPSYTYHSGVWTLLSSTDPCSYNDPIAYDAEDVYVLSLGTSQTANLSYATCRFTDASGWTQLATSQVPPYGGYAPIAYDLGAGAVVVPLSKIWPSSCSTSYSCSQTWAYSGGAWTNLTPMSALEPSGRTLPGIAYDPTDGYTVLFGGGNATVLFGDTWTLDLKTTFSTYPVDFQESGLASGTKWSVSVNGTTNSSTGTSVGFQEPNGTYTYVVASVPGYTVSPTNGTFSVSGASPTAISLQYVPAAITNVSISPAAVTLGSHYAQTFVASPTCQNTVCPTAVTFSWTMTRPSLGTLNATTSPSVSFIAGSAAGNLSLFVNASLDGTTVQSAPATIAIYNASTTLTSVSVLTSSAIVEAGRTANFTAVPHCTPGGCPTNVTYYWNLTASGGAWTDCAGCASMGLVAGSVAGNWTINVTATLGQVHLTSPPVLLEVVGSVVVNSFTGPAKTDLGASVPLAVQASGGVPPYSYAYSDLPPGCASVDLASWTCTPTARGSWDIWVWVNDSVGGVGLAEHWLSVVRPPSNLSVSTPYGVDSGQSFYATLNLPVNVSNGGDGTGPYTVSGLPYCPSATSDSYTGVLLLCTAPSGVTSFSLSVTLTDAVGMSTSATSAVVEVYPPLVASLNVTNTSLYLGETVAFLANASGGLGPYAYSYTGLPIGCVDVGEPRIGCLPTQAGNYTVVVDVEDQNGEIASASVNIQVVFDFTVVLPSSASVGQSFSIEVRSAPGFGSLVYHYAGLPPGCTSADTPELSCTPTAMGRYAVTISVHDAIDDHASHTVELVVTRGSPTFLGLPTGEWVVLGVGLAAIAALVGILLVIRRRRTGGRQVRSSLAESHSPSAEYRGSPKAVVPPTSPLAGSDAGGLGDAVDDLL